MLYFTGFYEQDIMLMTTLLDAIEFYSGTERKQMMTKNGLKHPKDGGSMLYGYTWKGYLSPTKNRTKVKDGIYQTKIVDDHPELNKYFREFASLHFPGFEWGQVQMNKNYPCPPHRDSANIGESVLVTCGDYTGGKTIVDMESKIKKYEGRLSPIRFNGSKFLHWVEPYEGTRYSLVFFHNVSSRRLNKNVC
jgi:hypothetical protein